MNITRFICTLIVAITAIASVSAWSFTYSGYQSYDNGWGSAPTQSSWAGSYVEPQGQYALGSNGYSTYGVYNAQSGGSWNGGNFVYGLNGYDSYGNSQYGIQSANYYSTNSYVSLPMSGTGPYAAFQLGSNPYTYPYNGYYGSYGYGSYGSYPYNSYQYGGYGYGYDSYPYYY